MKILFFSALMALFSTIVYSQVSPSPGATLVPYTKTWGAASGFVSDYLYTNHVVLNNNDSLYMLGVDGAGNALMISASGGLYRGAASGGQNIYNSNGTQTDPLRIYDADGGSLIFTAIDEYAVIAGKEAGIRSDDTEIRGINRVSLVTGDSGSVRIATAGVIQGLVDSGMVLTATSIDGVCEWKSFSEIYGLNYDDNTYVQKKYVDDKNKIQILTLDYGDILPVFSSAQIITSGSGSGLASVDLLPTIEIGALVFVSDLANDASVHNIQIDAGMGNTILKGDGTISQDLIIDSPGYSCTLRKMTATQWMIIATNQ